MSVDPKAKKNQSKKKVNTVTGSRDPKIEIREISKLESWKETDLSQFLKCLTKYPHPRNPEEIQALLKVIQDIPEEYFSRTIFTIIHQDYIDFIERSEIHKFNCIGVIKGRINDLLISIMNLDKHQSEVLIVPSNRKTLQQLFDEKLNAESESNLKVKSSHSNIGAGNKWNSLPRIEKLRFLYASIICVNDVRSRNESKLPYIHGMINLLIEVFLDYPQKAFEGEKLDLVDRETAKYKLKFLFNKLQDKNPEKQLKEVFDFERPTLDKLQDLTWNHENLRVRSNSLKELNGELTQKLNEAETMNQNLASQIADYAERIKQLEEHLLSQNESYLRLQETSEIKFSQELNSELSQLRTKIRHEFEKLQRGLEKYIEEEEVKSKFLMIMSKIENLIK